MGAGLYRSRHEKVASDLALGSGFCLVLRFPPPVITGLSHNLAAIWQKKQQFLFQNFKCNGKWASSYVVCMPM